MVAVAISTEVEFDYAVAYKTSLCLLISSDVRYLIESFSRVKLTHAMNDASLRMSEK